MRNVVKNTFEKGLVTDIHPSTATPNTLVDAHNVQYTTRTKDQFIIQKIDGVQEVVDGYEDMLCPLAVKEHNDVLYMLSYNKLTNQSEIGTYPSVDYNNPINKEITQPTPYVETADTWYDTLPQNVTLSNSKALEFDVQNVMNVSVTIRITTSLNLQLEGGYIRTLESGASSHIVITPRALGVGEITIEVIGLPELAISNTTLETDTIQCTVVDAPANLRPLEDEVYVYFDSGTSNISIYNNTLRTIFIKLVGEPGLLYAPLEKYEIPATTGDSTGHIIELPQVTKYLNVEITDIFGNAHTKVLTITPA